MCGFACFANGQYQFKKADYYVNNDQYIVKDCLKYVISEKKLPKVWQEKPPKLTKNFLKFRKKSPQNWLMVTFKLYIWSWMKVAFGLWEIWFYLLNVLAVLQKKELGAFSELPLHFEIHIPCYSRVFLLFFFSEKINFSGFFTEILGSIRKIKKGFSMNSSC